MFVQKIKSSHAIDRVRTGEPFDFASVTDSQFGLIEIPDLGKFIGDLLIGCDAVEAASLNHERPRAD